MNETLELLYYSSRAVGTVLVIACAGTLLVRFKIIEEASLKILSRIVFTAMLPCLLFSKVAASIDAESLMDFWILPVSAIVYSLCGIMLGFLSALLFGVKKDMIRISAVIGGIGNSSYIPIPLIASIVLIFPVFESFENAAYMGISYISAYLIFLSPIQWTLGYWLVSGRKLSEISFFGNILTPPLAGMLLGILVGLVPQLKFSFCANGGILNPLFRAADVIGMGTVPLALMVLGGKLAHGPKSDLIGFRPVLSVISSKLILMPVFAFFYVFLLLKLELVKNDNILLILILIVEACVPTATNVIVMSSLSGKKTEDAAAAIMFWTYLASIVTLTFFIMLTFKLFA